MRLEAAAVVVLALFVRPAAALVAPPPAVDFDMDRFPVVSPIDFFAFPPPPGLGPAVVTIRSQNPDGSVDITVDGGKVSVVHFGPGLAQSFVGSRCMHGFARAGAGFVRVLASAAREQPAARVRGAVPRSARLEPLRVVGGDRRSLILGRCRATADGWKAGRQPDPFFGTAPRLHRRWRLRARTRPRRLFLGRSGALQRSGHGDRHRDLPDTSGCNVGFGRLVGGLTVGTPVLVGFESTFRCRRSPATGHMRWRMWRGASSQCSTGSTLATWLIKDADGNEVVGESSVHYGAKPVPSQLTTTTTTHHDDVRSADDAAGCDPSAYCG